MPECPDSVRETDERFSSRRRRSCVRSDKFEKYRNDGVIIFIFLLFCRCVRARARVCRITHTVQYYGRHGVRRIQANFRFATSTPESLGTDLYVSACIKYSREFYFVFFFLSFFLVPGIYYSIFKYGTSAMEHTNRLCPPRLFHGPF